MPASGTRVGWGFDAHPLAGSPPLLIGGVTVSDELGTVATSDGDVLAHAVADALLGAIVGGDLGELFPSDDPTMQGADSMFLLRQVSSMTTGAGWTVAHVDATVILESPRLAPHRDRIRAGLAEALGIGTESVSVKATTSDGLGFIGRGEGVAAVAVVSVRALA